ncbi:hypothetical protein HPB48_009237 [Haemaphysalis longicornis]|uniref:Uncharacterized protein n=1 Tax=Haemaphysalis longicornis TaxID=44386 RepID=A0A9J6FX41_HAELO|nr:hypothetical protein HPB48_009237 [Haemaphysalis longicornis]
MLINCRSVKNKTDELTGLVSSFGSDIVIGSESWLDESISSSEVFPAEYVVYRKDRNTHSGGVFVLVKHSLRSFVVNFEAKSCESVWCKVVLEQNKHLTVGAFYRPPNHNSSHTFNTLSQILLTVSTDYTFSSVVTLICRVRSGLTNFQYFLRAHPCRRRFTIFLQHMAFINSWRDQHGAMAMPLPP